jgi:GTPase SAR1 family protein
MINGQKKVIQFCEEIAENAKAADIAEIQERVSKIADIAREQELIVPVVGGFSSGKSTLINTIIDRKILPVDISPETSLATELHYSPEEFIEAVKKDEKFDRYTVEEITTVKDRAADYKYSRLFVKNDVIKEIEPLVLVDMPGFDSPLDQHNKAINEYLDRGCHYIVLSSAEDTVSKSLLRRLKLIDECGRSFSFFLSKANLRTETVINELIAHYQQSIRDNLDLNIPIEAIGNASGQDVVRKLLGIDVNKLFFGLFRVQLSELCHDFINLLNTRINAS